MNVSSLYTFVRAGLFAMALTVAAGSAYAQVDRSKLPEPGPAPEINIADYESFTLKNGLKVFVVENDKTPRIAFNLVLDRDPIVEGEKAGYVSIAGDLIRRGTTSRTKDQLDEEIDFLGASLTTGATGVYASGLGRHSDKIMELFSDVILNPSFPEDEFEKIRNQILSGLQASKNDPGAIAGNVENVLLFGNDHPYGELTTEETVNTVTLQDAKDYYHTYYRPNVAYLAIVGDISKREAKKLVKKHLGEWEKADVPTHQYQSPKSPDNMQVALVDRSSAVQSVIRVVNTVELEPGHPDVIKSRVMNQILGGGGTARLFVNLRETHGFTYGAYSSISSDPLIGEFRSAASVRNEVTDSAVTEFLYELNKIKSEEVSEDELDLAIASITGSFARSLESPQTIANFAINTARYNLPEDYYSSYLKKLADVSQEDVKGVAEEYIKPENGYILVVGNGAEVAHKLSQFGEVDYYTIYGEEYTPETSELPEGLTATQVLDSYLQAIGGEEAIQSMENLSMDMTFNAMGMDLNLNLVKQDDGKYFEELKMQGNPLTRKVVNGDNIVLVQQGNTIPLDEKTKEEIMIDGLIVPESHYDKLNVSTELTGVQNVEGKKAYAVKATYPQGGSVTMFFDVETGLKIKSEKLTEGPNGDIVTNVLYDDYREVDGISFPYTMTISSGPQNFDVKVNEIKINTDIDQSLFNQ
ncbi:insulinase family protein [Roseivirga sp. BDSF3-8]|uniref:insulinase family protein n=1 Tax=Roseivirga sp. BDSF3-8 TaxID=3241598 RepID=UPI003531AF5E